MNAEKWHEDTTKGESPPPLMSLWARAIESTEFAARLQQPESELDAGQHPQPAPDEGSDSQETRASLLRAIESTEFAAHLQQPGLFTSDPPPSEPTPSEPTPSESTKSDAGLPASTFPMASPPWERRVNRPLSAAPPPVAASFAVQQRGLLPDHPRVLTPTPQTKSAARLQQQESESESDAGQHPQPAPDEEPDGQETRASLLRAIESTEFAAHLQHPDLSTSSEPPPSEPPPSEPTKSDASLPASTFPMASPPWDRQVNRVLSAAPPPVAASSTVQQRGLLPDHPRVLTPAPQTKSAARLQQQELESDAGQHPEPAPDEEPDSQETRSSLLRAIESTEFATHLQHPGLSTPEPPPSKPPPSKPTKSAGLPASTSPMARPPWDRRVNRVLSAAPPPAAAPSAVQQRGPLPDHPLVLMPAPKTKSAATEKAQDSAPPSPPASVEDRFPGLAFIARLKGEMRCLAPKIGPSTRALLDSAEERLSTWIQSWLALPPPQDPRCSQRLVKPPLVAYYWTGGTPEPQIVVDISSSGLYLATHDRWHPGTGISMALQRTDQERGTPGYWIAVNVMVVRQGEDGFGGAFIPCLPGLADAAARRVGNGADKETLERFVKQLTASTQL